MFYRGLLRTNEATHCNLDDKVNIVPLDMIIENVKYGNYTYDNEIRNNCEMFSEVDVRYLKDST